MNTNNFAYDFNALSQYLRAFAYNLTKDVHQAEDLYQDTAFRAFKNRDKFSANSNMKAWLCTIMKNIFINNFRSKKRRGQILDSTIGDFLPNAERELSWNDAEGKIVMDELIDLVDELDEHLKEPFLMVYQGYKYEEISTEMQLPLGTVKSRVFFARKKLKQKIQKLYGSQTVLELSA